IRVLHCSIPVYDSESEWILATSRSDVAGRFEFAALNPAARRQSELRLFHRLARALSYRERVCQLWIALKLRAGNRPRILCYRCVHAEPLQTVGSVVVVVRESTKTIGH